MVLFDQPTRVDTAGHWRQGLDGDSNVSGQGIASLVLGSFAVAVSFLPILGVPALVLGPLAVLFAINGRNRQPRDNTTATAGLILGITGTVIAMIITALTVLTLGLSFEKYSGLLRNAPVASAPATAGAAQAKPAHSASALKPSSAATGQPPETNCGSDQQGAEGTPVTFVVEGEPGKKFNVIYGDAHQTWECEGATGRWEVTRSIRDPNGLGITMWPDGGNDQV